VVLEMFDLLVDFFNQPPLAQDYVLYLLKGFFGMREDLHTIGGKKT
jgi:hypothetical protein